jgi:hypothetical protein
LLENDLCISKPLNRDDGLKLIPIEINLLFNKYKVLEAGVEMALQN